MHIHVHIAYMIYVNTRSIFFYVSRSVYFQNCYNAVRTNEMKKEQWEKTKVGSQKLSTSNLELIEKQKQKPRKKILLDLKSIKVKIVCLCVSFELVKKSYY